MARRAASAFPEIRRIILFGSHKHGIPTPHSDADLLIEMASSEISDPRDRAMAILRVMSPRPCPIDLVVYTSAEIKALEAAGSPLVKTALRDGIDLLAPHGTFTNSPSSKI